MGTANFRKQSETFNNSTKNFEAFDVSGQASVFIFAKLAGSSIQGSVKIQISPDKTNWVDVTSSSQNVAAAGNFYWNLDRLGAPFIRAVGISTDTDDVTMDVWGYGKE